MTAAHPGAECCALCLIDGIRSKAIRGWDGVPICREHVAQCIGRSNGQPVIVPTVDISAHSFSLH
jgi:hypothetical protein